MQEFLTIIFSFPVVLLTVPLIACVFYWLIQLLGFTDLEVFDPDFDIDVDGPDANSESNTSNTAKLSAFALIIKSLGLAGAPVTVSFSSWIVSSWLALFAGTKYFLYGFFTGLMSVVIAIAALFVALIIGLLVTRRLVKVLRPVFVQHLAVRKSDLIGLVGKVTTTNVTNDFGQGEFDDGGAGLILKIRADLSQNFKRGDRVVTIDYDKESDSYHIIRESDLEAN